MNDYFRLIFDSLISLAEELFSMAASKFSSESIFAQTSGGKLEDNIPV